MNPVDEALEALEKTAFAQRKPNTLARRQQQQSREAQMWQDWDQNGRKPKKLEPLMQSLEPFVAQQRRVYERRLRDIPPDVVRSEFEDHLVRGISSYDPNRGALLSTHLKHQLKRARRFVNTYQNPGRIVETRLSGITPMKAAQEKLERTLGREPTDGELAKSMGWSTTETSRLRKELRKAYPTGQFSLDPASTSPSKTKEILSLLPQELDPDENKVFQYVYGTQGKPQLGTNQIAGRLGMSAPKVSRLKLSIANKWKQYT